MIYTRLTIENNIILLKYNILLKKAVVFCE